MAGLAGRGGWRNASHAARARTIGIAEHTFRSHLRFIHPTLDVNNLNAALIMAVRAGLITLQTNDAPEIAVRMTA